jgi:thioredoxin reductase
VLLLAGTHEFGAEDLARLEAFGVPVIPGGISRVEIDEDRLTGVRLDDGQVVEVEALAVATRMIARAEVFAGIGITATEHPMGSFIAADPTGKTAVEGVWAAGNSADLAAQVSAAAANGALAGAHINAVLVFEDVDRAVARLADAKVSR